MANGDSHGGLDVAVPGGPAPLPFDTVRPSPGDGPGLGPAATREAAEPAATPSRPRPYFLPEMDFDALPPQVRAVIDELIIPAYEALVLRVADPLERAAGVTFVHLLFLELLDQFDLGTRFAERLGRGELPAAPRDKDLLRHFRIADSKRKAGEFLIRLREHGIRRRR